MKNFLETSLAGGKMSFLYDNGLLVSPTLIVN